jgi:hypothetical protein
VIPTRRVENFCRPSAADRGKLSAAAADNTSDRASVWGDEPMKQVRLQEIL